MSITSPPSRKKNPREPHTCATIESIVRHVQAEPTGEDVRLRTKRFREPWAVTRFWRSQIHSRPILGYRECKCNIKYERINASAMREKTICDWWAESDEMGFHLAVEQGWTVIKKSNCEHPYECTWCLDFREWEAEQDAQRN